MRKFPSLMCTEWTKNGKCFLNPNMNCGTNECIIEFENIVIHYSVVPFPGGNKEGIKQIKWTNHPNDAENLQAYKDSVAEYQYE